MLVYDIAAFTHKGMVRASNEDCILINGILSNDGTYFFDSVPEFYGFIADGVGGGKGGAFAAHFVLKKIRNSLTLNPETSLSSELRTINDELIHNASQNIDIMGAATTLTGILRTRDRFRIVHAGDSQVWLLRSDMFFKVTSDQVLDQTDPESPITSYFGGISEHLTLEENDTLQTLLSGDVVLISSDGMFKALKSNSVKAYLKEKRALQKKAAAILQNCLSEGATDNISGIIIEAREGENG